jgi:hypothetical protein
MVLKELTTFISDDDLRTATVYKNSDFGFTVKLKNDSGSTFSAEFDAEDTANDYAEDWIL